MCVTERSVLLAAVLLAACDARAPTAPVDASPPGDDARPGEVARACPPMFDQDIVPEYHVEISGAEWAALVDEFLNREARLDAGLPEHPYHPIELEYVAGGARERATAPVLIRLKGQSSWQHAVELDDPAKMQFVIAFNEVDPDGRFHGVRKIELDMPRNDRTFLKQRVALSFLRDADVVAQCANSARLHINGAYYGLYTNLERVDKELLQRNFGDDDEGDLWKAGRQILTNEDSYDEERNAAFWAISSAEELHELVDVDASIHAWAADAMVANADGYYVGASNFIVYDHPDRGHVWLPHDLDTSLDPLKLDPDASPVAPPRRVFSDRNRQHYEIVMHDPVELERYVEALRAARSRYDVAALQGRLDRWAAQIADAAADDPNRPFTLATHHEALARMRAFIPARAEYLDAWLACWDHGGADADGDGLDLCHDCDDGDPLVHPGAVERCDGRDNDCDGRVDGTGEVARCGRPRGPP